MGLFPSRRTLSRTLQALSLGIAAVTVCIAAGWISTWPDEFPLYELAAVEAKDPGLVEPEEAAELRRELVRSSEALARVEQTIVSVNGRWAFGPQSFERADRTKLEAAVRRADPELQRIEGWLESPPLRSTLEARRHLLLHPECSLDALRRIASALAAQALVSADYDQRREAAHYLRLACDLAALYRDGTILGAIVETEVFAPVFDAAGRIAQDHEGAPAELRRRLDDVLAATQNDARIEAALGRAARLARTVNDPIRSCGMIPQDHYADEQRLYGLLDHLTDLHLPVVRRNPTSSWRPRKDPERRWHIAIRNAQGTRIRAAFLRVALALLEYGDRTGDWPAELSELESLFAGPVPKNPITSAAFEYERAPDVVTLDGAPRGFERVEERAIWANARFVWREDPDAYVEEAPR